MVGNQRTFLSQNFMIVFYNLANGPMSVLALIYWESLNTVFPFWDRSCWSTEPYKLWLRSWKRRLKNLFSTRLEKKSSECHNTVLCLVYLRNPTSVLKKKILEPWMTNLFLAIITTKLPYMSQTPRLRNRVLPLKDMSGAANEVRLYEEPLGMTW